MKSKSKNKSHNINDYGYKEVLLMNKYNPGYIYYKAYQNIIEKLNKKKIQSGKILFKKSADNKITINKKRNKSGNIKQINTNLNTNRKYYLKNNDVKPLKKSDGFNSNNMFSKTYKSSFNHYKNNYKNIFSNLNNKNNPYSVHWANKILNINDVYLGVNYNSSVPLLKSLNIKRNPNQISMEIKKIQKHRNNTKNRITIKDKIEEHKNSKNNEPYNINELKEKSIIVNNINENKEQIIINKEKKNQKNNKKENNKEKENKKNKDKKEINIDDANNVKEIFDKKMKNKEKKQKENEKEVQESIHNFTEQLFIDAKIDLDIEPEKEEQLENEIEEAKNDKNNEDKKKNKNKKEDNDPLNYIQMLNNNNANNDLSGNDEDKRSENENNKSQKNEENKSEKDENEKNNQKQFAKIFDNNMDNNIDNNEKKDEEDDLNINEDIEKQFNTNQKNFFKFRKDIKEVEENLEDDGDENKKI